MSATVLTRYEIDIEDTEYLRHGAKPLLARIYKPRGTGPFPVIVDIHGGAWCKKDRTSDAGTDEPLARSGVVVVALDFRMGLEGRYPASMADINYAIRWCKARAKTLNARSDRVGILGVSSGGHQAMLAAMRPGDPRYAALPLPDAAKVDAAVACVVLCWPVIDPLGRYEYARKNSEGPLARQAQEWIHCHDQYWADEAAMAEGSPARIIERGERFRIPPAIYIQGTADLAHPVPDRERFINGYRKAGGRVELHLYDGVGEAFITNDPQSPSAVAAIDRIIEFVHRELD
ncbi:MAG TPA: alpha/beta hydrolase [Burkholderiales bacterium]|nr:alpha/beta hydrolase [Burkholderiales bacterium]